MANDENSSYLHYPITFHQKAFDDIQDVLMDGLAYSLYERGKRLPSGSEAERMLAVADAFNLNVQTIDSYVKRAKRVHLRNYNVMVNINRDMLIDFCTFKKSEFEIACFCAHTAIKSILGKKPYIKLRNEFLLARMFGYGSVADMPPQVRSRNTYKKYSSRYQLDKIKKELVENWGLKLYGRSTRGFYVSYTLAFESLVLHAERNRLVYQAHVKKVKEAEVLQKVMAQLERERSAFFH